MQAANRDGNFLAVAVVGFSRFGIILEALGRSETNAVFEEIASRLNTCVRSAVDTQRQMSGLRTAVVSDIGNGRFALMLTCDQELKALDRLCAEIEQELAAPAVIAGQTIFLSTSTGAAVYPQDSQDAESLLIKAETAMREAKARGAARRFFCSNSEAAAARRLEIEQGLYRALDRRELKLAYQPINDVMTNRVVAAEALLRWPQKDGSFIGPEEFVPIAEEAGLMGRLGNFVVEETCRQLQAWRKATCDGFTVAINVARSQLMDPNFPDVVARYLRDFALPSSLIDFEISERWALSGNDDAIRQLVQLKSLGVRVSVDDFGTGESSIAYLKDMPIDTLKIDRSYVAQLAADGRDSRMIAAMIALAKQLDLTVVAEGVESQAQLRILQSLSCDRYQGFLYSPAVFADEFCALVDPH
jgi:EAL domain-containing protein (putative c-di-GMP-specific phosphodiesterase class I)